LKTEADRADLASWQPDVLVVVAYGLILPRAVLDLPRLGCVNIHASLLPRWRGAAPIQRAILAGDRQTGVTIMLMDAGLDTGPMLLQRSTPITSTETGRSLHDRLAAFGGPALLEALDGLASGTLQARPQPKEGVTYAAKIDKGEALIDWQREAAEIERQVRAFNPWPVAETRLDGEQLRIFAARAESLDESVRPARELQAVRHADAEPGRIVAIRDDAVVVRCGRDCLAVTEVQRPGRRPVAARDFANTLALAGQRLG
jgi:methionyl-tRNA formyltransferase